MPEEEFEHFAANVYNTFSYSISQSKMTRRRTADNIKIRQGEADKGRQS
ncbi:hypothetical protein SAMN05421882_101527 [Nitrosomonas communis]|uniref:Uncharacterized protein n=1 Tax=Nitrosomonas communis TaxID=44574 RepID=A0A1H2UBR2_9PROT|nr:hypothetical protein SAMN05421882_101527 [Nitrosomonas communis]